MQICILNTSGVDCSISSKGGRIETDVRYLLCMYVQNKLMATPRIQVIHLRGTTSNSEYLEFLNFVANSNNICNLTNTALTRPHIPCKIQSSLTGCDDQDGLRFTRNRKMLLQRNCICLHSGELDARYYIWRSFLFEILQTLYNMLTFTRKSLVRWTTWPFMFCICYRSERSNQSTYYVPFRTSIHIAMNDSILQLADISQIRLQMSFKYFYQLQLKRHLQKLTVIDLIRRESRLNKVCKILYHIIFTNSH